VTLLTEVKVDATLLVTSVLTDSTYILIGHNNGAYMTFTDS
jgi:hypothetical protein